MTEFKSNVIICKNPRNDGLSNLLSLPADYYQSAQFYMDFNKIRTIDDIIDRLDWMESRGYHLTNDRNWVYRSENIARVVSELRDYAMLERVVNGYYARHLTRSGNLRQRVVELINEELDKLPTEDEEE